MSLPWRTGTEDVAAEGKPRGTWQYRKERGPDLYRLALARKMGSAGADQDLQPTSGSNKAINKVRTSHLHFWAQALPRGLPLPEQRNVCTRVRRYVAAPGSGGCLFQLQRVPLS
jgi:hypothetical protein